MYSHVGPSLRVEVRLYTWKCLFSFLSSSSHPHGVACVPPTWSVSTRCSATWSVCIRCSVCTSMLVRFYTLQLVYNHRSFTFRKRRCTLFDHESAYFCTWAFRSIYTAQRVYHQLGPSLHRVACLPPNWSVCTRCSVRTSILVRFCTGQLVYSHVGPLKAFLVQNTKPTYCGLAELR